MRAIGYRKPSPALDALEAFEIPRPTPESRDLLVEVRAVAVNPVDYKVASGTVPEAGGIKVVGYEPRLRSSPNIFHPSTNRRM